MDKLGLLLLIGVVFLVIIIPIQSVEVNSQVDLSPRTPASLLLIYSYGVGSKNILDTFGGTYTKDMIVDAPITIKMSLNAEEVNRIEAKLKVIGFFVSDYKQLLPGGFVIGEATPYSTYYLKVRYNGTQVRELRWSNQYVYMNDDANSLNELSRLIESIIEAKPEYQSLPEPRAGYC